MYAKLKTSLTGLAVALGILMVGYGLGEPPRGTEAMQGAAPLLVDAEAAIDTGADTLPNRHGALKRQMAMPYVSFAALLPRQEP